jgi:hypothetical protein
MDEERESWLWFISRLKHSSVHTPVSHEVRISDVDYKENTSLICISSIVFILQTRELQVDKSNCFMGCCAVSLVEVNRRFKGSCSLHRPYGKGSKLFYNVNKI